MNVQLIEEAKEKAKAKLAEYRKVMKAHRTAAEEALRKCYSHIAKGRSVIQIGDAIIDGGFDDQNRPRLAIVRADAVEVRMHRGPSTLTFDMDRDWGWTRRRNWDKRVRVESPDINFSNGWPRAWATPPAIPPEHRPPKGLARFHLLWEPEWREESNQAGGVSDPDPMLLQSCGKGMFAVLAVWDLTDVEMAVLRGGPDLT